MSKATIIVALAAFLAGCGSGNDADTVQATPEQMTGGNVNKNPQAREQFRNDGGGGRSGIQSGVGG